VKEIIRKVNLNILTKYHMRKITILFNLLLFSFTSCDKTDYSKTLPDETQTGKNTFGCLIDGSVWKETGLLDISIYSNSFYFHAEKYNEKSNINQVIHFGIEQPIKVGTFNFNSSKNKAYFEDLNKICFYQSDSSILSGTLEITKFDTIQKIISGRFNFKFIKYFVPYKGDSVNGDCTSIISITQGRFDYIF